MKPIFIHSGMAGAPQTVYYGANSINNILEAFLVNGFNIKVASSASASAGILTLNYASNPGFEALQTVDVSLSAIASVNGQHRVLANVNNQVTISIPGLPDGAVGSSGGGITIKQAAAGWSKPFASGNTAVFQQGAGAMRYLQCLGGSGKLVARGYESMTAIDVGSGDFPTVADLPTPNSVDEGAGANTPWFAIATSKWFIFSLAAEAGVSPVTMSTFMFGDFAKTTVAGDAYATFIQFSQGAYICRNYAGANGAVFSEVRVSDGASGSYPSVIADGAVFLPYVPVVQSTGSVMRGTLPNAYRCYPHIAASNFLSVFSDVAGVAGRMKPVAVSQGAVMAIAIAIDDEVWD